jgi:hypothetical protein
LTSAAVVACSRLRWRELANRVYAIDIDPALLD